MSQQHSLEVIDRKGWHQVYSLEKSLVRIGRAPTNEIVLEEEHGEGVSDLHAQLIAGTGGEATYQLVNLTSEDIWLDDTGDKLLPPGSAINVVDQAMFVMGEFKLVFHTASGAVVSSAESANQSIGLSLEMPQTTLRPGSWLDAVVLVSNQGEQSAVQFELNLDGLEPDCYDLAPGPLLSSGGEGRVFLRLYHRNARPLAGEYRITVRAAAPWAYPGEYAAASQVISVMPYYQHVARLLNPDETDTPPPVELAPIDGTAQGIAGTAPGQLAGEEAGVWSAEGLPARRERESVSVKARSPRPAVVTETAEKEAAGWWDAPPVTPAAPPSAIPPAGKSLAGAALVAGGAVAAGDTEWWAEFGAKPMAQEPLPSAAPAKDEADDWWAGPAAPVKPEQEAETAVVETAEPPAEESELAPQEPLPAHVPAVDEAGAGEGGPAASVEQVEPGPETLSAATAMVQEPLIDTELPPGSPALPETEKPDQTQVTPVLSPPPAKPRIFKPESGPEPKITLPPTSTSATQRIPGGEPVVGQKSGAEEPRNAETSEAPISDTAQTYLDRADAESNRAHRLASEVESAVESQFAKPAAPSAGEPETATPSLPLQTEPVSQQKPVPVTPVTVAEPPEWAHAVWGGDVENQPSLTEESGTSSAPESAQKPVASTSSAESPAKASDQPSDADPADWWDDDLIDSQPRQGHT